jgi:hypothetical protein
MHSSLYYQSNVTTQKDLGKQKLFVSSGVPSWQIHSTSHATVTPSRHGFTVLPGRTVFPVRQIMFPPARLTAILVKTRCMDCSSGWHWGVCVCVCVCGWVHARARGLNDMALGSTLLTTISRVPMVCTGVHSSELAFPSSWLLTGHLTSAAGTSEIVSHPRCFF